MADVLKKPCKSRALYFIHVTADVSVLSGLRLADHV